MTEESLRQGIVRWGRSLFERGLTGGSSGNISVKHDELYLMTPTNSCLGFLDPERLAKLSLSGELVSGDPPTKEPPASPRILRDACVGACSCSLAFNVRDRFVLSRRYRSRRCPAADHTLRGHSGRTCSGRSVHPTGLTRRCDPHSRQGSQSRGNTSGQPRSRCRRPIARSGGLRHGRTRGDRQARAADAKPARPPTGSGPNSGPQVRLQPQVILRGCIRPSR
jgi:hypothetical protein